MHPYIPRDISVRKNTERHDSHEVRSIKETSYLSIRVSRGGLFRAKLEVLAALQHNLRFVLANCTLQTKHDLLGSLCLQNRRHGELRLHRMQKIRSESNEARNKV